MKRLWVAAALAPLSFAASAQAQETISTATTAQIATATANSGAPGDITIAASGSVDPTVAGAAVTLNSNNTNVTNSGAITIRNVVGTAPIPDQVIGILGLGGYAGSITNTGAIQIDESATLPVNGTNGITYGNFATGAYRFGIETAGSTPLTGPITNNGTITIVGENSAGISIGSGGLTGDLVDSGTITVTGDNSFGIHAAGPITGNVTIGAALTATGQNAVGVALDQGATGEVDINSSITVTGFHSTIAPTTTAIINSLVASQLEAGGPAVTIGGSVGSGIVIDAPIAASGTGATAVAATTGGSVIAYGSPAMVIGGASPMTIGAGPSGYSLLVGGTVTSAGTYQNFNATGIQIGTSVTNAVTLPGGIDIAGVVSATSVATSLPLTPGSGQATGQVIGLHLAPGAAVGGGGITVSGALEAASTSTVGNSVTALQIDAGAAGGVTLTNTGAIGASITGIGAVVGGPMAAGGVQGVATAISDQTAALTTITNTGAIGATLTPVVPLQVAIGSTIALDQHLGSAAVTVTQSQAPTIPATSSTSATTPAAPSITGDVLFGSGSANLNLLAGTLTGAVAFGSGAANTLLLDGGAVMTGALTQATGGVLGVTVGDTTGAGALNMTTASHLNLSGLTVGSNGTVVFTVDPAKSASSEFVISGSASLAAGAQIGLNLVSSKAGNQTYTLITTAGSLNTTATGASLLGQVPYLFNATLNPTTGAAGSVSVTVGPRTAAQLGLNPAETAAYGAIFDQFSQDSGVAADVLGKLSRPDFIRIYDQFLPDFEGGPFDTLVIGQDQIARAQAEAPIKLQTDEVRGWVQEIGYLDNRQSTASTNGYTAGGFGIVGGVEQAHGDSAVGVSAAFVTNGVKDQFQGPGGAVATTALEAGAYWRAGSEGLNLHANVNGGYVYLSSSRLLFDQNSSGAATLFRQAKGQWNAATASGELGVSYQVPIGRFYVRPEVNADYVLLYESAFNEHGGGVSEDLGIAARTSQEAYAQGDLVIGADLGGVNHWRPELTVGWRQVLFGGPGDTTAHFLSGGPSFTLSPQFQDRGSLIARLGVRAGSNFADFSAAAGGQLSANYQAYNARAVARFLF
jgi:hypothetical protein